MDGVSGTEQPERGTHARVCAVEDGAEAGPVDLTRGGSRQRKRHDGSRSVGPWVLHGAYLVVGGRADGLDAR